MKRSKILIILSMLLVIIVTIIIVLIIHKPDNTYENYLNDTNFGQDDKIYEDYFGGIELVDDETIISLIMQDASKYGDGVVTHSLIDPDMYDMYDNTVDHYIYYVESTGLYYIYVVDKETNTPVLHHIEDMYGIIE